MKCDVIFWNQNNNNKNNKGDGNRNSSSDRGLDEYAHTDGVEGHRRKP